MRINDKLKDARWLSKVAIISIFLALIRCISEPFRLQHYTISALTFEEVKPFLLGALVATIALLVMTILFYYSKYKLVTVICLLTVIILLFIKQVYLSF
jgi:hypothetical protein